MAKAFMPCIIIFYCRFIITSIRLALRANLCYTNRTLQMNKSSKLNRTLHIFFYHRQTCTIYEPSDCYILIEMNTRTTFLLSKFLYILSRYILLNHYYLIIQLFNLIIFQPKLEIKLCT